MSTSITKYLTSECNLERFQGRNDVGDAVYAEPITVRCRISTKPRRVLTPSGETISSIATIHLEVPVTASDRFTWKDLVTEERICHTPIEIHNNLNMDGTYAFSVVML